MPSKKHLEGNQIHSLFSLPFLCLTDTVIKESFVYQQSAFLKGYTVYLQVKWFSLLFKLLLALFESLSQAGVAGQRTVSQSVNFMAGWSCLLMVSQTEVMGKKEGREGGRDSPLITSLS